MINKQLVEEVIAIAKQAGDAILEIYHSASDIEIQSKSDDSPLTKADKAANEVICSGLEKLDAQFPIISEENKEIPFEDRKNFKAFWLVDPLDGTKEFIKRNGEFTVNIALVQDNAPILGVIYVPVHKKMYWGLKGEGSYLRIGNEDKLLGVTSYKMADANLKVVSSRSHLNDATKSYVAKMNEPDFVPMGSSLKFMIVAEGKADVYPRFIPCMEWDTAAAQIIMEEAGGSVMNIETQQPLTYNKKVLLNPYFIAFGKVEGELVF